jgi:DNA topoisomerase IB
MARKSKSRVETISPASVRLEPGVAVVLYHGKTGAIFSTHYFSASAGAELPGKEELERIALSEAARDGCKATQHKALHVDPATLQRGVSYRVSIKKQVLKAVGQKRPRKLSAFAP